MIKKNKKSSTINASRTIKENALKEPLIKPRKPKSVPVQVFNRTLVVQYKPSWRVDREKLENEIKVKFSHLTLKNQVHRSTIAKWITEYAEQCVEEFIYELEKGRTPSKTRKALSKEELRKGAGISVQLSSDGERIMFTKDKRL